MLLEGPGAVQHFLIRRLDQNRSRSDGAAALCVRRGEAESPLNPVGTTRIVDHLHIDIPEVPLKADRCQMWTV